MIRPVAFGKTSLSALSIVVALGVAARASLPYLPLIGPPALRLQPSKSLVSTVAKITDTQAPREAAADQTAATALNSSSEGDDTKLFGLDLAGLTNSSDDSERPTVNPLSDTFTASIFQLPTPDLVGMSPQMLAMYFRPVQHGTNSAARVGLFPVSFRPPLPPDKSSKAEYIVK